MEEFSWERFWCEPSDDVALSDEGYLVEPGGGPRPSSNPAARALSKITAKPCLALIGELGIGKSVELRHLADEIAARGESVLRLSLGDFRESDEVRREIFEDETFRSWAAGTGTLTIILDGLDEALGTNPRLAGWLAHQLGKYDRARLHLRIACRRGVDRRMGHW